MPLYGDDWGSANQAKLYTWKRDCHALALAHSKHMRKQQLVYKCIKLIATFFVVTTSTLLAFQEQRGPGDALSQIAIVAAAIVALMNGVDFLLAPQEKSIQHKQAHDGYSNLVRTIDYFCSLPPKKRPDVEVAYVTVTGEMYNLETSAPPVEFITSRELDTPLKTLA